MQARLFATCGIDVSESFDDERARGARRDDSAPPAKQRTSNSDSNGEENGRMNAL